MPALEVTRITDVADYDALANCTNLPTDCYELWRPLLMTGWLEIYAALPAGTGNYMGRLACILDHRDNPWSIEINSLFVNPNERCRGIGRSLMATAEVNASSKGAQQLELSVSPRNRVAVELYQTLGYQIDHAQSDDSLQVMSKSLR